jgi:hypothetical protein
LWIPFVFERKVIGIVIFINKPEPQEDYSCLP